MAPNLALLLCIAFVLFLLKLERKHAPETSPALWVPTLWYLYIASKPLAFWFSPSSQLDVTAGAPLDQLFLAGLLFIGLLVLASRGFCWSIVLKTNRWLIVLLAFLLISTLWSDIPYISLKRWVRQLQAVIMGFVVLSETSPQAAMESLLRRTTYILIPLSLLLIKYFPEYGLQFDPMGGLMWVGATVQKNGLGRLCLISAYFLIWTFIWRWQRGEFGSTKGQSWAEAFLLMLTLFLLKGPSGMAASATGMAALAAGLTALGGLVWMKRKGRVLWASLGSVVSVASARRDGV